MYNSKNDSDKLNKLTSGSDGKSFFHRPESEPESSHGRLRFSGSTASMSSPEEKISMIAEAVPRFRFNKGKRSEAADTTSISYEMSREAASDYKKFYERRNELTDMLSLTSDVMQNIGMFQLKEKLSELSLKVSRDTFKIQIVGNFKNGKSTFINSFLGEEILPAYALPCTAVINEVKYGTEKRAIIHFKNPLPPVLPHELSLSATAHIKKHGGSNIPPLEIPYDKIEDYVVIPMGKDPKDMLLESPYERVELFWPLELLRNGIEIIDSPGLNEHTTRTKVTMDFLSKSDAIIFVLNATMLCSKDEMAFIKQHLHSNGFKDLFFVVNRFDMIPENERERIKEFAKSNLSPLTSFGEKGLFFLSAKNALDAKRSHDEAKLKESGLLHFERILSRFLTKRKGSTKLISPARALYNFLTEDAIKKILPKQQQKLIETANEAPDNLDSVKLRIEAFEKKRDALLSTMTSDIGRLRYSFENAANSNMLSTISSVYAWIDSFTPATKLGLMPTNARISAVTDEILENLRTRLEENNAKWHQTELLPLLRAKSAEIFASPKEAVDDVIKKLHFTGVTSTGKNDMFAKLNSGFFSTADGRRGLSSASMLPEAEITGKALLAIMSVSSSSMVKANTSSLLVSLLAKPDSSVLKKLKEIIADEIKSKMRQVSSEYVKSVTDELTDYFIAEAAKTVAPLDDEISALRNHLDSEYAIKAKSASELNARKEQLIRTESELRSLAERVRLFVTNNK